MSGWAYPKTLEREAEFKVLPIWELWPNVRAAYAHVSLWLPDGWAMTMRALPMLYKPASRYGVLMHVGAIGVSGAMVHRSICVHTNSSFQDWVDLDIRNGYTETITYGVLDLDSPHGGLDRLADELKMAVAMG